MAFTFALSFSTTTTTTCNNHPHICPPPSLTPAFSGWRPQGSNGSRRWKSCVVSAAGGVGGKFDYDGPSVPLSRRQSLSAACLIALTPTMPAVAAILEADDDVELLERVKRDKKKRIERQELISSSGKETGYVQELVYRLDKVGQAIDKNDLAAARLVLGPDMNADWVRDVNAAFTKLSSSPEEKSDVDDINSSLVSLISSVGKNDAKSSKVAFVSSATALEKWVAATGLTGQLKGL